jgi:adenylate cyclase
VTILCSDIRGFSRVSARMDTDDIVDMLNAYFQALVRPIMEYDGTIDKFIGDAILAVFGSPEPDAEQHAKALRTAVAMQAAVKDVTALRALNGQPVCEIGIGIHCGEALHGFVGSPERMEYTVIGDAVNKASRYCDAAPPGEILVSPEHYQRVWQLVHAESLTIKTKHEGDLPAFRIKTLKSGLIR